jgi:hypothetical protein
MKQKTPSLTAHVESRYISDLIQKATQVPHQDIAMIENIMRSDIFHSTLDWQSREQLVAGAKEAHALLVANRELFEFEQEAVAAHCSQVSTQERNHD